MGKVRGIGRDGYSDPKKFFQVGAQLPPREKEKLITFLRENIDVFEIGRAHV